jgi:hypothetical protein
MVDFTQSYAGGLLPHAPIALSTRPGRLNSAWMVVHHDALYDHTVRMGWLHRAYYSLACLPQTFAFV